MRGELSLSEQSTMLTCHQFCVPFLIKCTVFAVASFPLIYVHGHPKGVEGMKNALKFEYALTDFCNEGIGVEIQVNCFL